jgi:SOS regulatory protein LexA
LLEERPAVARIPLLGRVVAGVPVTSEENVERRIPVPAEWTRHGTYFALRVAGDSMRDAGILAGDQVIIRKQSTASDGDLVVATLEGETTLKRLQLRGSRATLVAENPHYRKIDVRTESAIIQGVVVGLMRKYGGLVGGRDARFARGASSRGRAT